MTLKSILCLAFASAAVVFAGVPQTVAGGPAVSGINGKITPFGGGFGADGQVSSGIGGLDGSLTMPLSHAFGLQLDGGYARLGDDDFVSTGAHVFWRDPDVGMFGFYAGYSWLDQLGGIDVGRVGLEAQRFADRFTLDGAIGYLFADADDIYGRAKLDYYPTENLMLSAGYAYELRSLATVGAEYQFASSDNVGTALFAKGSIGENNAYSVLGGFRVFLGENMTLINRHRKQDPASYTTMNIAAAGGMAAVKAAPLVAKKEAVCSVHTCFASDHACSCPPGYTRTAGLHSPSFACNKDTCSSDGHCTSWDC